MTEVGDQPQLEIPTFAGGEGVLKSSGDNRLRFRGVEAEAVSHRWLVIVRYLVDPACLGSPKNLGEVVGIWIFSEFHSPPANSGECTGFGQHLLIGCEVALNFPALADVGVGAVHPFRSAVRGPGGHLAAVQHPDPMPVSVPHAGFHFVKRRLAGEVCGERGIGGR